MKMIIGTAVTASHTFVCIIGKSIKAPPHEIVSLFEQEIFQFFRWDGRRYPDGVKPVNEYINLIIRSERLPRI